LANSRVGVMDHGQYTVNALSLTCNIKSIIKNNEQK
jgi:hypothetical protein